MKNEIFKETPKPTLQIRVECYAGYKADQRPLRFYLGAKSYQVQEVLDQWYGPEDSYFKVKANDGNFYILRQHKKDQAALWTLESFRRAPP